jgi:hypothetical protein
MDMHGAGSAPIPQALITFRDAAFIGVTHLRVQGNISALGNVNAGETVKVGSARTTFPYELPTGAPPTLGR